MQKTLKSTTRKIVNKQRAFAYQWFAEISSIVFNMCSLDVGALVVNIILWLTWSLGAPSLNVVLLCFLKPSITLFFENQLLALCVCVNFQESAWWQRYNTEKQLHLPQRCQWLPVTPNYFQTQLSVSGAKITETRKMSSFFWPRNRTSVLELFSSF